MELRLAVEQDLPRIKNMYRQIVAKMIADGFTVWDEVYPCEFLEEDIKNQQMYVLENQKQIVSAYALCPSHTGSRCVEWQEKSASALYIDRLGVNVDYLRKGIGFLTIQNAMTLCRQIQVEYLRLFVVDSNIPAVQLYQKAGFTKAGGVYEEIIDDDLILHEYGFEIRV